MTDDHNQNSRETIPFQAEVNRVMDIVVNSLYTDREIFVRELISNAVDALEKMRHISLIEENLEGKDSPLEIRIALDEENKTFSISDTGVGMIRDELVQNLGNIAHSGAVDFLEKLEEHLSKDVQLIGQFGVGFYSIFMVAEKVTVSTKSYLPVSSGYHWTSDGKEGFTIEPAEGLERGTTITLHLKEDALEFAKEDTIKRIIKQYSNFVPFPVFVKDEKVNTIEATWAKNKQDVTEDEYKEFYKFQAGAYDEPLGYLHFSTDAPLALKVLVFVPQSNMESLGFGKTEPAVDLHCKKVLIQKKAAEILPPWLRFLKGVVDSEDIPLNISREKMQDSILIRKINKALTNRFVKFLVDKARNDQEFYDSFWKNFGTFIKEGVIADMDHRKELAPLLRYETSKTEEGKVISLDDYIERMKPEQKEIYFINGFNKETIVASPYLEVFLKKDVEVIYCYDPADDFVMSHLESYQDKKLVSADSERLELPKDEEPENQEIDHDKLTDQESNDLKDWMKRVLKDKVTDVRISTRLVGSPVVLVNPDAQMTGAMHRLMQAMNKDFSMPRKLTLEFNPKHQIIKRLDSLRQKDTVFAELTLEQLVDQASLAAGFSIEIPTMVDRVYTILNRALEVEEKKYGEEKKEEIPENSDNNDV